MTGRAVYEWFVCREVLDGVWQIAEATHVNTWLVSGEDRAVLLDTGLGIRPIRPVAERLVSVPVDVVTTHYHFDHVGGHHEFAEIAIHRLGAERLTAGVPPSLRRDYLAARSAAAPAERALLALDEEFGHLTPESRPRPLPAGFGPGTWGVPPSQPTQLLDEGDVVELGGRALRVLHSPGHSPDGISLLDEAAGVLFVGDAFNLGQVYCHFADSSAEELAGTARRLADLAPSLHAICTHHYERVIGEPNLLANFARAAEAVAAEEAPLTEGVDCFGYPVRIASFDHVAITVPPTGAPPIHLHNSTQRNDRD